MCGKVGKYLPEEELMKKTPKSHNQNSVGRKAIAERWTNDRNVGVDQPHDLWLNLIKKRKITRQSCTPYMITVLNWGQK